MSNFKRAYFDHHPEAVKIMRVLAKVFFEMVDEDLINEKTDTVFNMCEIAWAAYEERNQQD